MAQIIELTVSQYAELAGIDSANKAVLIKQYGIKIKKTDNEWFNLLKSEFIIPKQSQPTIFTVAKK